MFHCAPSLAMVMPYLFALLAEAPVAFAKCRCTPLDSCWPSVSTWDSLNASVDGRLTHNTPLAKPCYPGPGYSADLCQHVSTSWTDEVWLGDLPIGYSYPLGGADACPPINASIAAYPICELGPSPVYSIKATNADDVAAGIKFAKDNNVRLVVKLTGHDLEHKSQGYGSLSIWIRSIQNGLNFQDKFKSADGSCKSNWTGPAVQVNGGYLWQDIYKFAGDHGHVVVGGQDRTVGILGGYMQGGGHSVLSHYHGLAADQVLEYQVVLASGEVVLANECQNTDLFTALRGGGGGTYGVVISATIKTYPARPILVHNLNVAALPTGSFEYNVKELFKVVSEIVTEYPSLSDAGWSGTAWFTVATGLAYYGHPLITLLDHNSTAEINKAKASMEEKVLKKLNAYKKGTALKVTSTWKTYNSFAEYTFLPPFNPLPAGNKLVMSSWLFDRKSVESPNSNITDLLQTLNSGNDDIPFLTPGGGAMLFNLVSGGKVLEHVPHTSVHPAWRKSYLLVQQMDTWPVNSSPEFVQQKIHAATFTKLKAMQEFSPGMGTYGNEADPYDPDWKKNWWGDNYDYLLSVKEKYDPDRVFWTWRSVGNDGWDEVKGAGLFGPLCQISTSTGSV